ncbi:MAG: ABC transporter substrate-binding protein [Catonella sp.]|nr:ABC transporter substrate-binding protein [Catonella sp.]MDY6356114.1 ABC transporter substrate-binding protein [Catonella sp.]
MKAILGNIKLRYLTLLMVFTTCAVCLSACAKGASDASKSSVGGNLATSQTSSAKAGSDIKAVALSKSTGDLWLLAGGKLIGITEDGLDLDGIGDVTSIGTVSKPNLEAILSLEPDLVLLSGELSSHREIKEKCDEAGIKTISVTENSFDDYSKIMKELTDLTGHPENYTKNVTDVSDEIDDICKKVDQKSGKTYLAIRVSASKNKALKNDYFACDIFNDLGLTNVVTDDSELEDLSLEWIADVNPDYIFAVPMGDEEEALDGLKKSFESQPVWKELNAVKSDKVFVMPKDLFQYKPNASWAEAYKYAYGLIYDK